MYMYGFPGGSVSKESACSAGDLGSILGSGKLPGEGNGNPLQYSCLENSIDRSAWTAAVNVGRAGVWVTRIRYNLATKSPPQEVL